MSQPFDFDLSIEENAEWDASKIGQRPVPSTATGDHSMTAGNLQASPYQPIAQQALLPSPTLGQAAAPGGFDPSVLSSPVMFPASGHQAISELVSIGHLDTNDTLTGDVKSDPIGCFYEWVEKNQDVFIARLAECVAIPGVSAEPKKRQFVFQTIGWAKRWCDRLGGITELRDLGEQELPDGSGKIPLPPILLATFGDCDPSKRTLCVYGHLDVQPADASDGWDIPDPFQLTEIDGKLFGRGSTDDKGPVLCWLWFVEYHRKFGLPLPVNMKCIFEGMEESGSVGFDECMEEIKDGFMCDVDGICVSDNYWTGCEKPCVTYGLRGIMYFGIQVGGGSKDLHSGAHGGAVCEPMTDLTKILASLSDASTGQITIPGISDEVLPLTPEERKRYEDIDFNLTTYGAIDVGHMPLTVANEAEVLMRRTRYPSISVHGIEGAFYGPGAKTVIPRRVTGKFSIRTVPNMTAGHVEKCVQDHIKKQYEQVIKGRNVVKVKMIHAGEPWIGDLASDNFKAAIRATEKVHNVKPDLTREGGSIPIVCSLQNARPGTSLVLLPIGAADDGAHSQNEKISRWHYITGVKTLGTYVYEYGSM